MKEQSKLTVLYLSTRIFPDPNAGGPAKFPFFISKYLSNKNIYMINVSSAPFNDYKNKVKFLSENHEIHYLPILGPSLKEKSMVASLKFFILFLFYSIIEIMRIHRKRRINLIQASSPSITGIVTLFFRIFFNIPFIFLYHGVDYLNKVEIYVYKYINKYASKILVISRKIIFFFKYVGMYYNKKTAFITNGIECPEKPLHIQSEQEFLKIKNKLHLDIDLNYDDQIILYVGRMIFKQKVDGMVDFLHAFTAFLDELDDSDKLRDHIKLLYIGDGKYRYLLEDQFNKNKYKNKNIFLLGVKPRNEVPLYFSIADLSVLTSYNEGFPNVLVESMISGVPCLASDVGETKEIIKDTGFIVKRGDKEGMKNALAKYFNDRQLQICLKKRAFERVKNNYDWDIISLKIKRIYFNALTN